MACIRWTWLIALLLGVGALGLCAPVMAAEAVPQFGVEYHIQPDGTVEVIETIVYDFGDDERHGIYRQLRRDHPQPATHALKERLVEIEVTNVRTARGTVPYEITDAGDAVRVRIGDPNQTVTGVVTYELRYTLTGALSYGSEGAEFYWNVTGNEWDIPIVRADAAVTAPPGTFVSGAAACYEGPPGTSAACANIVERDENLVVFQARGLSPGSELTIAQELQPEAVAVEIIEEWRLGWLWFLVGVLVLVLVGWRLYRYRTQHRPQQAVVAQYEPYRELLPMYTGVVFDGRLDPHDIAAGIVYLAEQGFISIERTEQKFLGIFNTHDYEVTLEKPLSDAPNEAAQSVLSLLFHEQETSGLNSGLKAWFGSPSNTQSTSGQTVGSTVRLSSLPAYSNQNRRILQKLQKDFKKQLRTQGYFERMPTRVWGLVVVVTLTLTCLSWLATGSAASLLAVFFFGPLFVAFASMPRRSNKGYEARWHLLGFKDFLATTDKERFNFHNAPERNPNVFMEYLPYAIAFKVEKKWAAVFDDVTIPAPEWYRDANGGAFSAAIFTAELSTFTESFNSSTGTSGSAGGGSAGGGGGGGGGGSW